MRMRSGDAQHEPTRRDPSHLLAGLQSRTTSSGNRHRDMASPINTLHLFGAGG